MWLIENWSSIYPMLMQHIGLAAIPTLLGLVISLVIGAALRSHPRGRSIALVTSSVVFSIPSLALFVMIPSILGTRFLDPVNVVIALTLYSVALSLRTVFESFDAVPRSAREAATAIGFGAVRRTVFVDLPLAIPVLAAGTRVVAVANVSMVSVGALIGVGGLGKLFTDGYQRDFPEEILWGIGLVLALAVAFDRAIALLALWLTPWTNQKGLGGADRRLAALRRSLPGAPVREANNVR
jgi:osmoprotectant transport system permease protein